MGQELLTLLKKNRELSLCAVVDEQAGSHRLSTDFDGLKKKKPKVVIDFSSPEGTEKAALWCQERKVALVTGTTGLSEAQKKMIKSASRHTAVFSSPNMSVGVNAMISALEAFVARFNECDVEIEEIHHRHKKDKPSGTAKLLHESLKGIVPVPSRLGQPVSLRGGEIFGIHKVYFFSEGEWLCFEHQATDRSVFARGALRAAAWVARQKPGFYTMKDVLEK
jgi:4-hydroxy-tetrahydrodipicolinate reductase